MVQLHFWVPIINFYKIKKLIKYILSFFTTILLFIFRVVGISVLISLNSLIKHPENSISKIVEHLENQKDLVTSYQFTSNMVQTDDLDWGYFRLLTTDKKILAPYGY